MAGRFFWTVLILATLASIGGNVTHALLKANSGPLVAVAAAVAMVPPIVLLAATHSVGLLVRTRSTGPIYWAALAMTVGLAGCAFALICAITSFACALNSPGTSSEAVKILVLIKPGQIALTRMP